MLKGDILKTAKGGKKNGKVLDEKSNISILLNLILQDLIYVHRWNFFS